MALSLRSEELKQVPWLSLHEWYHVYQQIYSTNPLDQKDAYETMLAWKVSAPVGNIINNPMHDTFPNISYVVELFRIPKLPVGVDCTLSIIQVCLRDREWTPKMDCGELSIGYESDLCLMYSTTIMKFLNHIGNIGVTKQTSLYNIAKQLKIPEWIVNLRHDAAHGHELPSLSILRVAANFLLSWIHEEYWMGEARVLEECCVNGMKEIQTEEAKEIEAFKELLELWIATGLYIHAGYRDIKEVPDSKLQHTLEDLRVYALNSVRQAVQEDNCIDLENTNDTEDDNIGKNISSRNKYDLLTAREILLTEISRYFGKRLSSYKENVILNALLTNGSFFPREEMLHLFNGAENINGLWSANYLPIDMLKFWQDVLLLLQKKRILGQLVVKLIEVARKESINKQKRLFASLWASSILYGYVKLSVAREISRTLERKLWMSKKKLTLKILNLKVKEEVNRVRPDVIGITWFDMFADTPSLFKSDEFVQKILIDVNEVTVKFLPPLLELAMSNFGENRQKKLKELIKVYLPNDYAHDETNDNTKLYAVEDLSKIRFRNRVIQQSHEAIEKNDSIDNAARLQMSFRLGNKVSKNTHWVMALETEDWVNSPIGLLPWQLDSMESLKRLQPTVQNVDAIPDHSGLIPGIIKIENLRTKSRINWDTVLRKRKKSKRKQETFDADIIIDRAIQAVKKRK